MNFMIDNRWPSGTGWISADAVLLFGKIGGATCPPIASDSNCFRLKLFPRKLLASPNLLAWFRLTRASKTCLLLVHDIPSRFRCVA